MDRRESNAGRVIAVCGKGGVGKTALSAAMVRTLSGDPARRVLAIDADPAVGLAAALGVGAHRTVDDIRNQLVGRLRNGQGGDKAQMIAELDYEMFSAVEERGNLAFLAIGRPETEGCYCQVNRLLKDIIRSLADNFDVVVIDGEAGIEQVNRRVMNRVTHLILVSDASAKGLNVVRTIRQVADSAIAYDRLGLILNRIRDDAERSRIAVPAGLECVGWVPEDDTLRAFDIAGRSLLEMPDGPALRALAGCLAELGIVPKG